MEIVIPHSSIRPYTDVDLDAIIDSVRLPVREGREQELRRRLQRVAAIETEFLGAEIVERDGDFLLVGSRRTKEGRAGRPRGPRNWTRMLAEVFKDCFRERRGKPFLRFYREASKRLIKSAHAQNLGLDLQYLLYTERDYQRREIADETIRRNAGTIRKK